MKSIRKMVKVLAPALALSMLYVAVASAEPSGNDRKGKYAYRGVYEKCMQRGEVTESKPPLSPDAKTQAQWERVFEKKDFTQFGCAPEWTALTEDELTNILAYLWKHAADSPTPAKCK